MKFSTREDIDAPIDAVFNALCEFEVYERAAMRRGAEIRRRAEPVELGVGTTWDVRFQMRGKERQIALEVSEIKSLEQMIILLTSKNFNGTIGFELMALSRSRTRVLVGFEVRPLTLSARILLKSAKLTKPKLDRKYCDRVGFYIQDIESRLLREA